MNENEVITPETVDDDWSDISFDDLFDDGEGGESKPEEEKPEADQQNGNETEGDNGKNKPEENGGEGADQTFTLKYLGAEKAVNRDEVITLAQKGMDYDRIRGRYDEAEKALAEANEKLTNYDADMEMLGVFKQLAESQQMDITQFAMQNVAAVNAAKNGTTLAAELPKVKLDFERKSFEKQKSDWEKNKGGTAQKHDADAEMKAEIEEFQTAFPEAAADAKAIPKEVWDAKNAAPQKSLAQHYRDYLYKQKDAEIANLKSQLEQAEQNALNKYRSTGSQSSGGSSNQGDIWDRMWAEE